MSEKFSEINADTLRVMLNAFYDEVQKDELIGPIFIKKIGTTEEDWAPHMDRVVKFWCSVLLNTKEYGGGFMIKHAALPKLEMEHFKRWMEIFMRTVPEHFETSQSVEITIKAQTLLKNLHQQYGQFQVQRAQKRNKPIQ
ncbi:group III truncated hemoglobin [Terasakiella sp. SH-1]|uniref:group III truncated hemoglobin n=1 Tax=Terasakiella sp. SH-1 TaxID=2560057 RepID=UPI001073DC89|nr:group III truncated hemoglobin [Terasakiella sp. SH-1]